VMQASSLGKEQAYYVVPFPLRPREKDIAEYQRDCWNLRHAFEFLGLRRALCDCGNEEGKVRSG